MARLFDGVDDRIQTSIGGLSAVTIGGSTWVAVVRRGSDSTSDYVISLADGSAAFVSSLRIDSGGAVVLSANSAGGSSSAFTVTAADGWVLIAASKPSGVSQNVTYRKYAYATDAWTHGAPTGSVDNGPTAGASGTVRIGSYIDSSSPFDGDIAAVAVFGRVLTQAEIENLAHRLSAWVDTGPAAMWVLDQADVAQPVRDWTSNGANQTAIVGTSTAATGPPIGYGEPLINATPHRSVNATASPGMITATSSIPTPGVSRGAGASPGMVTATSSIPAPTVFTGDPVTPAQPDPIQAVASIPTPTLSASAGAAPPVLLGRAVINTPVASVPVNAGDDLTGPGQLSYNGFKLGGGTPYSWQELTGWWVDMPPLDNGDVPHPSAHGAMPGEKLAQARIVTYESLIKAPRDQIEQVAMDFLAGLPVPDADEQLPLAVQVLDQILIGYGACTQRAAPIDKRTKLGHIKAVAQFTLANPRLYSRELANATITDGGSVQVTNLGNVTTPPLLRLPGPAVGPELVVERRLPDDSTDLRVLEFDVELSAGQTLIIDPSRGTAVIGDVSQRRHRTGASVAIPDFVLGPGVSELSYTTAGGGAPAATALWRHAYM